MRRLARLSQQASSNTSAANHDTAMMKTHLAAADKGKHRHTRAHNSVTRPDAACTTCSPSKDQCTMLEDVVAKLDSRRMEPPVKVALRRLTASLLRVA